MREVNVGAAPEEVNVSSAPTRAGYDFKGLAIAKDATAPSCAPMDGRRLLRRGVRLRPTRRDSA